MKGMFAAVKEASRKLLRNSGEQRTSYILDFAKEIHRKKDLLIEANDRDLATAKDLSTSLYQRLKLDTVKLDAIAEGIELLAKMPDPIGSVVKTTILDDNLTLSKVLVPLGVLGIIFESRPDVIPQILSLAIRSGNGVILKGGKEASNTNEAFMGIIRELNEKHKYFPGSWAVLLSDRASAMAMLDCPESIDLIIPRGSNALVSEIVSKSKVPVLGHADGVCHIYVDRDANFDQAISIILDAKTQYPAACNAVEMVLLHEEIAEGFVSSLVGSLKDAGVVVHYPAKEDRWRTEYGDLEIGLLRVPSIENAICHINTYGSHHTDVIITANSDAQQQFFSEVDSACVFANCSSRFADGQRFGLGAEVGIATGKLHARGPVGIEGLLTTQYQLVGDGHRVATYTGSNAKKFLHRTL